jgi:TerC family integral membrane protein
MLHVTAGGWAATIGAIAGLLSLDWLLLGRRSRAISFAQAVRWSLLYIAAGLSFGAIFGLIAGWDLGAQYLVGYVVEKSLSVDNLFVFMILIGAFAVPARLQPRALTIGIVLALLLRAAMIALGAALLEAFSFMFLAFGLALLATSVQLHRHRDEDPDVGENPLLRAARRVLPLTDRYHDGRLVVRGGGADGGGGGGVNIGGGGNGRGFAFTPLFMALLAIGTTDVIFAFDSIPAVFGVTRHAYIVFAANAFALLGLRPLFFLVSGLLDRLIYISSGLAAILAFIGVKLVLEFGHEHVDSGIPHIGTVTSLVVVVAVLAITVLASLLEARRQPGRRAHAGAIRAGHQERGGRA